MPDLISSIKVLVQSQAQAVFKADGAAAREAAAQIKAAAASSSSAIDTITGSANKSKAALSSMTAGGGADASLGGYFKQASADAEDLASNIAIATGASQNLLGPLAEIPAPIESAAVSTRGLGIALIGASAGAFALYEAAKKSFDVFHAMTGEFAEIGRASQSIGIANKDLQGLVYAGSLVDTSLAEISVGMRKFSQDITNAHNNPGGAPAQMFRDMQVAVDDANGAMRPTIDILKSMADQFRAHADGATKSALAVQALGRSGLQLIPFLNQGGAAFDDLTKRAKAMGLIMSDDDVKAATEFEQSLVRLAQTVKGLRNEFLTPILKSFFPSVEDMKKQLADLQAMQANHQTDAGGAFLAGMGVRSDGLSFKIEALRAQIQQLTYDASKFGPTMDELESKVQGGLYSLYVNPANAPKQPFKMRTDEEKKALEEALSEMKDAEKKFNDQEADSVIAEGERKKQLIISQMENMTAAQKVEAQKDVQEIDAATNRQLLKLQENYGKESIAMQKALSGETFQGIQDEARRETALAIEQGQKAGATREEIDKKLELIDETAEKKRQTLRDKAAAAQTRELDAAKHFADQMAQIKLRAADAQADAGLKGQSQDLSGRLSMLEAVGTEQVIAGEKTKLQLFHEEQDLKLALIHIEEDQATLDIQRAQRDKAAAESQIALFTAQKENAELKQALAQTDSEYTTATEDARKAEQGLTENIQKSNDADTRLITSRNALTAATQKYSLSVSQANIEETKLNGSFGQGFMHGIGEAATGSSPFEQGAAAAKEAIDGVSSSLVALGQALMQGQGKDAFKAFALSIIQMSEKIVLQLLIQKAVMAAVGAIGGGGSGGGLLINDSITSTMNDRGFGTAAIHPPSRLNGASDSAFSGGTVVLQTINNHVNAVDENGVARFFSTPTAARMSKAHAAQYISSTAGQNLINGKLKRQ